eukprot:m51a1_g10113 putative nucleolar protein 6 (1105) ;mRNA; f:22238-26385
MDHPAQDHPAKRKRLDDRASAIAALGDDCGASDVDDEQEGDFIEDEAPQQQQQQQQQQPQEAEGEEQEELAEMQRAEEQYKSNLFRLQVVELLREAHACRARADGLEGLVRSLGAAVAQAARPAHAGLELVGSWATRTEARPLVNVDVAVVMPDGMFTEDDVSGDASGYLEKRREWVAGLAQRLQARADVGDVTLEPFLGDTRKPIVSILPPFDAVAPRNKAKAKAAGLDAVRVRLLPCLAAGAFAELEPCAPGCAFAANAVLEDTRVVWAAQWLHARAERCAALRDAVALAKSWLHARSTRAGPCARPDGVNGFLASLLVAHLLDTGRVNRQMSSYQILRVFLSFAAAELSSGRAVVLGGGAAGGDDDDDGSDVVASMESEFEVVVLDADRRANLAARVSRAALREFCDDARRSLEQLDADCTPAGGFDELFLRRTPAACKYDCVLRAKLRVDAASEGAATYAASGAVDRAAWVRREALRVLERGVGKRCLLVRELAEQPAAWAPDAEAPEEEQATDLVVGLVLNPETCLLMVERGPAANDEEGSEEFKKLWGDKVEIRRFKDGAIIQTTVWDDVPRTQRHLIVKHMCQHLLKQHFGVGPNDMYFACGQLDPLLEGEDESLTLVSIFDDLAKRIRDLELPLAVRNILPTSAVMRYTEVCPPQAVVDWPTAPDRWVAPVRGVIRFELSGSWPNDVEAVRKVKMAFYVKIAQGLKSLHSISAFAYPEQLEVFFKGYAFAFQIHTDNELNALRRSPEGAEEAARLVMEYVHLPLHHAAIHTMALRHVSFTKACRLAKRWVHAHLFARHIRDEAIELLVAHVYCNPAPLAAPFSHLTAFLRFLRLAASLGEGELPALLVTDFEGELKAADHAAIADKFQALRDEGKLGSALFLSTPYDRDRSVWTRATPSATVLRRLAAFAQTSADHLERLLLASDKPKAAAWQTLFRTPMGDYDIVLKLDRAAVTRACQRPAWMGGSAAAAAAAEGEGSRAAGANKRPRATLSVPEGSEPPVVGFDTAALYVDELHRHYGARALLFYDDFGGDAVAVALTPAALEPQPMRLQTCQATEPSEGRPGCVVVNPQQLAADMERLGSGLVTGYALKGAAK